MEGRSDGGGGGGSRSSEGDEKEEEASMCKQASMGNAGRRVDGQSGTRMCEGDASLSISNLRMPSVRDCRVGGDSLVDEGGSAPGYLQDVTS
jgi:hypothetical protein